MRKNKVDNPRYPHTIRIVRMTYPDRFSKGSATEEIIYEGVGRSYTETTTTGDRKVDTNKRKASIPVRYDEWGEKIPMSGDIVKDNNRSVIYGEHNRNLNDEGIDGQ